MITGILLLWPIHPFPAPHPAVTSILAKLKDKLSIVGLTNLLGANPDRFIDEIAGFISPISKS